MTIKLTDNEWGILEHRLDIYDCIAECYADTMYVEAEDRGEKMTDEQHKAAYALAHDAGARLNCDIRNARQIDTDKLTDLDKWILADCLDGTTFFTDMDDAVWDGQLTKGKALALRKAGHSLQRKLNEAGIPCQINLD
jgi:hypothetical protein